MQAPPFGKCCLDGLDIAWFDVLAVAAAVFAPVPPPIGTVAQTGGATTVLPTAPLALSLEAPRQRLDLGGQTAIFYKSGHGPVITPLLSQRYYLR